MNVAASTGSTGPVELAQGGKTFFEGPGPGSPVQELLCWTTDCTASLERHLVVGVSVGRSPLDVPRRLD